MRCQVVTLLFLPIVLTSCGAGPHPADDAGFNSSRDAGAWADAGERNATDAGTMGDPDAGMPTDAGIETDAGAPFDAGNTPDAAHTPDSGASPDAGTSPDAGARPDAGAPSTASFFGDFESGTTTGKGHRNWASIQSVAADRYRILTDGQARQGTAYARVEVRPGDDPLGNGETERSEVLVMQNAASNPLNENETSGTQRYSFSVKLDSTWKTMVDEGNGRWAIFLQIHGPDALNTNPAWAFTVDDEIRMTLRVGDITKSRIEQFRLSNGALNKGKWIDFILTVKYAKDDTGFLNVQRRDEGDADFAEVLNVSNTATLQYSSKVNGGRVGDHYIKHGLYRNRQSFTSVLYLDGFTRSAVP
jgi:hypothetical protein